MKTKALILCICFFWASDALRAISTQAMALADHFHEADAVVLAKLVKTSPESINGRIQTQFTFRTLEAIAGNIPAFFKVSAPGGVFGSEARFDSRLPKIPIQKDMILFLRIDPPKLCFSNHAAGVVLPDSDLLTELRLLAERNPKTSDLRIFATHPIHVEFSVTSSGLLDSSGSPFRYTSPDRSVGISVYADVSTRPSGITEQQAITALRNALSAWENASTIRFNYLGTQIFPKSADDYSSSEGEVIRIQMHDNYSKILDTSSTLGSGGSGYLLSNGEGGTINGTSFFPSSHGFVLLNHPKSSLSDPKTLEEVLTHEIGHVLGLAHSSENISETNSQLKNAVMYFQCHSDGRGATLNDYDTQTILKAYPWNTPPYGFDRIVYAVSSSSNPLSHPEVNQVTLSGADLQNTPLSLQIVTQTSINGNFTSANGTIRFTPSAYYSDSTVSNLSTEYYDQLTARFSDGTNFSPPVNVRVVGFRSDSKPTGSPDGIPDSWMTTHFGNANGSSADADFDKDGLSNLREFLLGTDPKNTSSCFKIVSFAGDTLTWTSQPFDSYYVQSSSDLVNWTNERLVNQPSMFSTLSVSELPTTSGSGRLFYRVKRIE